MASTGRHGAPASHRPPTLSRVTAPAPTKLRARTPGCARAEVGRIDGRHVVTFEIDASTRRGALSSVDGSTIAAAARTALAERLPLIGYVASSGSDISEGVAALHGWGLAARAMAAASGTVPIVLAVTGPAVSGPALLLGLADQVVMTTDSYAFVSGPTMVAEFTGERLDNAELGGAAAHARHTGAASVVVADDAGAREAVAQLLAYLPDHSDALPHRLATSDPADRKIPEVTDVVPDNRSGAYDVRRIAEAIVDEGELFELRGGWAPNLVTALATVDGWPVGVVANQPMALAGTVDIWAAQKGARFVGFCDSFNLPIVTLVDTSGFYPGKDQEWRGMIRHGAQLVFAYAQATVPRVGVILRKSYGGAYIVMDSKGLGNDVCLAWPSAELAVMGAKGAIEILHRRASAEERAALEADYEERMLNPYVAAARGLVDAVIDPAETRAEVAHALGVLHSKAERLVGRKHGNGPL